jgi:hypothetical protein
MDFPRDSAGLAAIDRIVRKFAKRLKQYPILKCEAEEDLAQDLYVCLIETWPKYDPARGPIAPFVHGVLTKKSAKLLRKCCCQKRPNNTLRMDFDQLQERPAPSDDIEGISTAIDMQKKLRKMPNHIRQVLEQLKTKTSYRVAKDMNISRFKLNKLIENSRFYFKDFSNNFYQQTKEVFMSVPLNFLDDSSIQEVSGLNIEELSDLAKRLKEAIDTQDRRKRVLNEAMRLRFEDTARAILNQEGKDTGTARFQEGDTTIIANFRKRVDWDENELMKILAEHPEYKTEVKRALSIDERKYNNFSKDLQEIFEPARSVKVSSYEFSFKDSTLGNEDERVMSSIGCHEEL